MLTLVLRDLQHRRWRILLVTLLIAVVIALLFVMNGLIGQFDHEPIASTGQISDESLYLVSANSSGPLTTPQAIPAGIIDSIDGATGFLMGRALIGDDPVMMVGMPIDALGPSLVAGDLPTRGGQMVVDATAGLSVGDAVTVGGRRIDVVGLTSDATVLAGLPLAFVPLETAQITLLGGEPIVSGALVPAAPDPLSPAVKVMTPAEVAADVRSPLDAAVDSISLVRLLLWMVTTALIASMIYATATSRVRDVAVLKAVGGRDGLLAGALVVEAIVIALLATGLGALLHAAARPLFPLTIRVPASSWWQVPLLAVGIAVVAATLGIRKVLSTSPAEAFG